MVSAEARSTSRHVVLIGVAAVGKTTLGEEAAARLAMPCLDVDIVAEVRCGLTISQMSDLGWTDDFINGELWKVYQHLMASAKPSVVVASPRILDHAKFWKFTEENGSLTVHLRWLPLRILRREMATHLDVKEEDVSITQGAKHAYYRYYWWRLRHCGKADHELRLSGNLDVDTDLLVALVAREFGRQPGS